MWCSTVSANVNDDYLVPSPTQQGLWSHSHNPETDLLKRFVIAKQTPSGKLWLSSYHEFDEAFRAMPEWSEDETYYLIDQFNDNYVVLSDTHD